jgi:MFS family permease
VIPETASGALAPPPARALALDLSRVRLSRTLQLALAYLAVAIPALAMAFVQPVWQLTDEAQHTDVLAQYAHGVYPIEGVTTLRPETVAIMVTTGNYRWSPPETVPRPAVVDPAQFGPPPPYLSGSQFKLWVRRHIWWFSYEAMQPPLFYALATPVWAAGYDAGGPFAAVYAVRVLNALLLALLGPLTLATAWLLAPGRRLLALLAVTLTAFLPGLLLNGSQVTNDTLGAVLGAACVLLAARLVRGPWSWRGSLLLGVLFGLTLLAKLTDAGLAIGLAMAWAWPALKLRAPWRHQLAVGAASAAVALLVMLPWLLLNVFMYGHPVPSPEAAKLLGAGTSGATYTFAQSLNYAFQTFWTGEHKDSLPYTGVMVAVMLGLGLVAAVGLSRLLRGTAWLRVERGVLVVLFAALMGQTAWALAVPATSGLGGMTPGRYLYPVVAAAMVLFAVGLWSRVRSTGWLVAMAALFVGLSLTNQVAYAFGKTAISHAERNGPPTYTVVSDVSGSDTYRGVTVTADRVVTDRRAGGVWVHLHVRNESLLSADWSPNPQVKVSNGLSGYGDYPSSAPFPETLPGHSDYWGWIRLGLAPGKVPPGSTLRLIFHDVAANHYRDVSDLTVSFEAP